MRAWLDETVTILIFNIIDKDKGEGQVKINQG